MPNENQNQSIELSRRQILGGIGSIGVASASAGLGTTAFFSDEEQFANNQLVAGEFDLKVDWAQIYNGEPVDAFPDEGGDGLQDEIRSRQEIANDAGLPIDSPSVETMFRDQFADIPDDRPRPLIELDDVKPGDSGEITFSFHLFDNPGYIWMNGRCIENPDNGLTEPEADDPDEDGSTGPMGGELADAIQVTLWADDGNNELDDNEQVLFQGSLADGLVLLSNGFPLDGNPATVHDPLGVLSPQDPNLDIPDQWWCVGNGDSEERDCYSLSSTNYIGLEWELPVDHANELQTDSVTFDLGFYAEQCRHNTGRASEEVALQTFCDEYWVYRVDEVNNVGEEGDCFHQEGDILCFRCPNLSEECPDELTFDGKIGDETVCEISVVSESDKCGECPTSPKGDPDGRSTKYVPDCDIIDVDFHNCSEDNCVEVTFVTRDVWFLEVRKADVCGPHGPIGKRIHPDPECGNPGSIKLGFDRHAPQTEPICVDRGTTIEGQLWCSRCNGPNRKPFQINVPEGGP